METIFSIDFNPIEFHSSASDRVDRIRPLGNAQSWSSCGSHRPSLRTDNQSIDSVVNSGDRRRQNDFKLATYVGDDQNVGINQLHQLVSDLIADSLAGNSVDFSVLFPMMVYGPGCTGKSSLARSFASDLSRLFPENLEAVFRISCGDFCRQYAAACHTKSVDDFLATFEKYPILIFDNLEEVQKYPRAIHELENLLDLYSLKNRFVIFTSRNGPWSMERISPRLLSRISAGTSVQIHHPGPIARKEIGRRLNYLFNAGLDDDQLDQICLKKSLSYMEIRQRIASIGLDLESNTEKKTSFQRISKKGTSRSSNHLSTESPKNVDSSTDDHSAIVKKIISRTARHFGLTSADLRGSSRKRSVKLARNAAIFLLRHLLSMSYQKIGIVFGGRDHSTIINSFNQMTECLSVDDDLRMFVDQSCEEFSPLLNLSKQKISTG